MNGVQTSFLRDTGAAVTLLRKDTWNRIAAMKPQDLSPLAELQLVGVGGSPLTVHGSARVDLELQSENFTADVVVVSQLTMEAIFGLDFLTKYRASIDLGNRQLRLGRTNLPLREPESATTGTRKVRAEKTTEIPAHTDVSVAATTIQLHDSYPEDKLREAQLMDPTIGSLLRSRETGDKPRTEDLRRASRSARRLFQLWDQLLVHNVILCCLFESPDDKVPRIRRSNGRTFRGGQDTFPTERMVLLARIP